LVTKRERKIRTLSFVNQPGRLTKIFPFIMCFSFFSTATLSQPLEVKYLIAINAHGRPAWDNGMRNLSVSAYPVGIVTPFAIWSHGFFTKNKEMTMNGYKAAICISSAMMLSTGLKLCLRRHRPYVSYPHDIVRRDPASGPYGFPSGHTTAAFATATSISLSYHKWYITVPAYAYAGLMAYSRMRLGVHYPSDILGGMVLGVGSGLLTWEVDKWLKRKRAKKGIE
jgi:undecaprenyl-diphosphatase